VWAPLLYSSSVVLVGTLAARRLLVPTARGQRRQPVLAAGAGILVAAVAVWAVVGPLAPHWGGRAGGTAGNRTAASSALVKGGTAAPAGGSASGFVAAPFRADFQGRLTTGPVDDAGRITIRIDGALQGGTRDHLEIFLRGVPLEQGGVAMEQSRVRMGAETALYQGEIVALHAAQLVANVHSNRGSLRLGIDLRLVGNGLVNGSVSGTRLGSGSA
jgi:hypothetical protein